MQNRTIGAEQWETHLRTLGESRLPGPAAGAPEAFVRWASGERAGTAPAGATLDGALWWALLDGSIDPAGLVEPVADGPLFSQVASLTIEVWTERELSGLHALERLARRRGDAWLSDRAVRAARWHVERTQPDNATNRPWAAHLFLAMSLEAATRTRGCTPRR